MASLLSTTPLVVIVLDAENLIENNSTTTTTSNNNNNMGNSHQLISRIKICVQIALAYHSVVDFMVAIDLGEEFSQQRFANYHLLLSFLLFIYEYLLSIECW